MGIKVNMDWVTSNPLQKSHLEILKLVQKSSGAIGINPKHLQIGIGLKQDWQFICELS